MSIDKNNGVARLNSAMERVRSKELDEHVNPDKPINSRPGLVEFNFKGMQCYETVSFEDFDELKEVIYKKFSGETLALRFGLLEVLENYYNEKLEAGAKLDLGLTVEKDSEGIFMRPYVRVLSYENQGQKVREKKINKKEKGELSLHARMIKTAMAEAPTREESEEAARTARKKIRMHERGQLSAEEVKDALMFRPNVVYFPNQETFRSAIREVVKNPDEIEEFISESLEHELAHREEATKHGLVSILGLQIQKLPDGSFYFLPCIKVYYNNQKYSNDELIEIRKKIALAPKSELSESDLENAGLID